MKRITLYTPDDTYMGWVKADWKSSALELGSWMRYSPAVCSANYVKYCGQIYDSLIELKSAINAKG